MTRLFLDSGDPKATRRMLEAGVPLAGQTTNPSLIAHSPSTRGKRFSENELWGLYRDIVRAIAPLIPKGSVSIETFADHHTSAEDMVAQARELGHWIPNAHIKFPTNVQGLRAAMMALEDNLRVNMTLVFSQSQAAAVYAATRGAKKGDVFVSPFVGRLDDIGHNGLDLVRNILDMYTLGDGHVEVLAASIRSVHHLRSVMAMGTDIATCPEDVLLAWIEHGTSKTESASASHLQHIPYERLNLHSAWTKLDLRHPLTSIGITQFVKDWGSLLKAA